MIIVFDLDDTLYEEITYVRSGFKAVANHLSKNYKIETSKNIYRQFVQLLEEQGRGKVFDSFLDKYNLSNRRVVKKCLAVYKPYPTHNAIAQKITTSSFKPNR